MSFGIVRQLTESESTPRESRGFQNNGVTADRVKPGRQYPLARMLMLACLLGSQLLIFGDDSTAQNREKSQNGSSEGSDENRQVSGSRLLSPESFGFQIPQARTQPTDLTNVTTQDEQGETVVARVHVKVGDNFIVMLPNGCLVDRMAEKITPTDKEFEAASQRDIAREVLDKQLARFSNMKFERSKHYVYLHNTTPEFKAATRGILESMYNGVKAFSGNMGIDTHHPEVPLVVIMFRSQVEFQAYRPMPAGVVAYYDMVSNHIVLCQESPLADVRPDLAQGQLLSTIAHEGAHQILHNIGVQQRLSMWPMWLSEGLAEFFAPTSFGKRNKWKGAGQVNDLRMFELESFMQTRYLEGFDGRTISEAVTAGRLDSTGYATAWSIVHFLAKKKRRKFYDFVAQMSKLRPMRGMVDHPGKPVVANLVHFQEFFGKDTRQNEVDMVEYLGDLKYQSPVGDFIHYVGMADVPVENGSKKYACFFHTQDKVAEWKAVLESRLTADQKRSARWEVQKTRDRGGAYNLIQRFMR